MELKIFWQPDCPACPPAKELGEKLKGKMRVSLFNTKDPEGLSESIFHEIMSTPSLVLLKDGKEIAIWRGKVPTMEELEGKLDG